MVQEDNPNSRPWMNNLRSETPTWTAVAIVDSVRVNTTTTDPGENSGIIDMSPWLGTGWWALDVQAHQDTTIPIPDPMVHQDQYLNSHYETWDGGPVPPGPVIPPGGASYRFHRENGQLLFIYVPES